MLLNLNSTTKAKFANIGNATTGIRNQNPLTLNRLTSDKVSFSSSRTSKDPIVTEYVKLQNAFFAASTSFVNHSKQYDDKLKPYFDQAKNEFLQRRALNASEDQRVLESVSNVTGDPNKLAGLTAEEMNSIEASAKQTMEKNEQVFLTEYNKKHNELWDVQLAKFKLLDDYTEKNISNKNLQLHIAQKNDPANLDYLFIKLITANILPDEDVKKVIFNHINTNNRTHNIVVSMLENNALFTKEDLNLVLEKAGLQNIKNSREDAKHFLKRIPDTDGIEEIINALINKGVLKTDS